MRSFFYPSSVVVFGVSNRPSNLGKEIAGNLLEFGFNGVIHFVGQQGGVLFGQKIWKSLDEIDGPIDLAIILTPAKYVPDILKQCGKRGILKAVIESGGFGELDSEGKNLGSSLLEIAETYGMRFVGPNCIGLMNSENGFCTPFTTMQNVFKKGQVGIIAQSGGVALSFLNMFHGEQIGYSKFAAIGNKLSVDENDFMEYYISDEQTSVICLYLESIKNGKRLMEIAKRSEKPIVIHKANISDLTGVVAQSHTDALTNDDSVVDAAFRQAGMVRFHNMQSYLDFVKVLLLPRIKGRNLAIVSRSGGHAVIGADAAFTYNFDLPDFGPDFLNEIRKHLRADVIRLGNPLDLGDLFDFEVYIKIVEHTLQQDGIDAVLFLHTYFAAIEGESSRNLLSRVAELSVKYDKPVAMSISTEQFELSRLHKEFDFPIFMSPERAVSALDTLIKYENHKKLKLESNKRTFFSLPDSSKLISDLIRHVQTEKRDPSLLESLKLIESLGIRVPPFREVKEVNDIDSVICELQPPYALKIDVTGLSHKSDVGGIVLNLTASELKSKARGLVEKFGTHPGFKGLLIQQMLSNINHFEMIVGGKRDPHFGSVIVLGYGGVFVELLKKLSIKIAPVSDLDADAMINELPSSDILSGVRGQMGIDKASLIYAIRALSETMLAHPEINSIEINPLVCSPQGTHALDARIFLKN